MKLKDHPDIIFDTFPKLYERSTKVFITHLNGLESELSKPPANFCKMYMTRVLAEQLSWYLNKRCIKFSRNDFVIVESFRPFKARLSGGAQLEVMFCDGNELGNTSVVLVRRCSSQVKEPLLYFYSAIQQTAPERLLRNESFRQWISNGTDRLFLNLCAASKPWVSINFDEIAQIMGQQRLPKVSIELPIFGYEFAIKELAQRLRCQIALCGMIEQLYKMSTSINMTHFATCQSEARILFYCKGDAPPNDYEIKMLPLDVLQWTPMTSRDNLLLFCSLLRPKHIDGIIMTKKPEIYRAPQHLFQYCPNYHRKKKRSHDNLNLSVDLTQTQLQTQNMETQNLMEIETTQKTVSKSDSRRSNIFRLEKRHGLHYIDDSSQE